MSTYDKLGQYSATELPLAPSNVILGEDGGYPTITWTENYTGDYGTMVIQQWKEDSYWETIAELSYGEYLPYYLWDLSTNEGWRLRVGVKIDDVIYAAPPVVNGLPLTPMPTNLAYVSNDSGFTSTISWDGYDESWQELYVTMEIQEISEFCDMVRQTIATLPASATTYTITGYTLFAGKSVGINVKIADEVKSQTSGFLDVPAIHPLVDEIYVNKLYLGGTAVNSEWSGDWNSAAEINTINNSKIKFSASNPKLCECCFDSNPINLANSGGTFTIRSIKTSGDSRPNSYEFTPADFGTLTGVENSGGAFKLTVLSSINYYNIVIDFTGTRSITVTPYNG